MIHSMTGFGQSGRSASGFRMQVDVKSVNHRYAETTVRMPREWLVLEEAIKKRVSLEVKRGRVDVFVSMEREGESGSTLELNWDLAREYMEAARMMKKRLGFKDDLTLRDLLQLPDVVRLAGNKEDDPERIKEELLACVGDAVDQLIAMRKAEGVHLKADLDKRLGALRSMHDSLKRIAPAVAEEYRLKLLSRMRDILGEAPLDENRVMMEAAIFADRSNIDEELTRLDSHFNQFGKLLLAGEPAGRKLDFLIQEMNREVNTIGSKANQPELSAIVVEMKAELEKIREQVQNIE